LHALHRIGARNGDVRDRVSTSPSRKKTRALDQFNNAGDRMPATVHFTSNRPDGGLPAN